MGPELVVGKPAFQLRVWFHPGLAGLGVMGKLSHPQKGTVGCRPKSQVRIDGCPPCGVIGMLGSVIDGRTTHDGVVAWEEEGVQGDSGGAHQRGRDSRGGHGDAG